MPSLIFRKGLDLKDAVAGILAESYHSHVIEQIKASDYRYAAGRLTIHLAREFGFCYGVDRAVDYAYQARTRFPNQRVFMSWYGDFSGVTTITDAQLAAVPLGTVVTYRPGVRLVKIQSDPKVYAVSRGGLLRWVQTESAAFILYGPQWNRIVHDIEPSLFFQYTIGAPIGSADLPQF